MPFSSTSCSLCSLKLIRNCIPSLHLFSNSSQQPTTIRYNIWPVDLIETICIETFGLTAHTEPESKWVIINNDKLQ
ncbi:unnamed protein product [Rotaria sordida]|uniref:Uncharacterized protein n=1 Tax=Rotaria sordida TaxID=392033 RepID=A0A818RWC2_9BILA|nr:unnamed protein product [Rotaria sordida]CAF3656800.1 unnamed protein product [Rotaria sordida]